MSSNTLDELGRAVLETLEGRRVTVETLESEFDVPRAALDERVTQLVDNALAREDRGAYELTENGLRVLNATPTGARDDRIDTPEHVEEAIQSFSGPPDEAAAVRKAFSFLRYWGEATSAEIVDATYTEVPAGFETPDRWWHDCVRDRLAALPDVRFDPEGSVTGTWCFDGRAVIDLPDEDGRTVDDPTSAPFGSVRHGLESLELIEGERSAARRAFEVLFESGSSTTDDLVDRVLDDHPAGDHPAGYETADAWANWLSATLEALPGIDRTTETTADGARTVWTYRS